MKPTTTVSTFALTLALTMSLGAAAAFADGMPDNGSKPQPVLTPLDKALDEIQNNEPPVAITPPEPEPVQAVPPAEPAPEPEQQAVEQTPPPVPEARVVEVQPNSSFFGLSVGMYDPFTHGRDAASFNMEFQPGVKIAGVLQPLFGALVTTQGAFMGYGGVGLPLHITDHVMLMPSVAVAAYKEGKHGYDLGQTLAYRVGTELAYVFDDQSRIGLNAHVITNGKSLGREDRTEVIGLAYTMPIDFLSGGKHLSADTPAPAAAEAPAAPVAAEQPAAAPVLAAPKPASYNR